VTTATVLIALRRPLGGKRPSSLSVPAGLAVGLAPKERRYGSLLDPTRPWDGFDAAPLVPPLAAGVPAAIRQVSSDDWRGSIYARAAAVGAELQAGAKKPLAACVTRPAAAGRFVSGCSRVPLNRSGYHPAAAPWARFFAHRMR